jgi:hypothetical protein
MNKMIKAGKISLLGFGGLILVLTFANWLYKMSGSNKWELELDKNGVQVYSLKTPGSGIKQFKGVVRGQYSLNQLVAGLVGDQTLETCLEWIPNCMGARNIERWDAQAHSETTMWTFRFPWPLSPREFVNKSYVSQDPVTKIVRVDFLGAPNKLPPTPGCVRATDVHNYLTYTPLEDGTVEVVNVQHYSMAGLIPDAMLNIARVKMMYAGLHDLYPRVLNKERYKKAHYEFIVEPGPIAGKEG